MATRSRSPAGRSQLHWIDRLEVYGTVLLMIYLTTFAVLSQVAPELARPMAAVPKILVREGGEAVLSQL
jgi:hypothetical protein